ncbi:hypothetical protein Agabi119p4_10010 [Agaricus bisporus var. burnettii]|uniref:RNA-directed DNA polymerase n=1 Tax=Agaricus bisporus var. burnettii TaxID=192524 RepID=A0A8H7C4R1_AGABI|nr:hypothetical protein Agabi119p4_10010 [Agaricus bisporus var. burnettii]
MNNRYVVPQKRLGVQELEVKPLLTTTNGKKLKLSAMVDSGCTHTCIDEELVKKKKIPTKKLERPITCRNSDGTIAGKKDITKFVKMDLNINGHNEQLDAVVTPLQSSDLFLGHDWLTNHNPEIDWKQGIIKFNRCPTSCSFPHTDISFEPRIRRLQSNEDTEEKEKVKAIRDWAVPTTVKQVESFLGFANFYRRFIKNFSTITQPLNELKSKKGEKWYWNDEQQQAFEQIKQAIASEPVLALPKDKGQFRIEVDASNYGTGAVLSQEQENKWHPVAFMSKTLSEAERNYEIYDKELLAIIKALKLWRHYLLDAKEQFEIWTDHENLKYFREPQKLNARQARWYLMLQEYDFLLRHIPGKTNTKADILSRLIKPDTSNDNRGVEMFKEKMFIRRLEESTPIYDVTLLHN